MATTESTQKKPDTDVAPAGAAANEQARAEDEPGRTGVPSAVLQRKLAQRRKNGGKSGVAEQGLAGPPGRLPHRAKMEASFGQDLGGVEAHTGPEAKEAAGTLGTEAYTSGQKVAFADENPSEEVVAHEAAHTLQQKNGGASGGGGDAIHTYGGSHADPLEREADLAAKTVVAGGHARVTGQASGEPVQGFASLSEIKTVCKDGAQILWELSRLTNFHLFSGTFEGDLDVGKAAYYAQLVSSSQVLHMLEFDAGSRGSNLVHLQLNLYQQTFSLSAKKLQLSGFTATSFACRASELDNVTISGSLNSANIDVGSASMHDAQFINGKDRVLAAEVGLSGLRVDGNYDKGQKSVAAGMSFSDVHVHGLSYPGMPPVDVDVKQAGLNFDMLWTALGPKSPGSGGALPQGPNVLPQDSRVQIELDGLHAAGSLRGGEAGGGGFDHFHVKVVAKDGHEMAAITIDGFHGGGASTGNANGSIDRLAVTGEPAMVKGLLDAEQVKSQPQVRQALDVIKSCGLEPAVGGSIVLQHVGVTAGPGGKETAKGDLSAHIVVPGHGALAITLNGFVANVDQAALAGSFDKFTAALADKDGKELAYLELDGAAGKQAGGGKSATGGVKHFVVRGNVAELVKAAEAQLKQLPPAVRGALDAVRALGLKGDASGDLTGDAAGGNAQVAGDLELKLDAPGAGGEVKVSVKGFRGDEKGSALGASFTRFEAHLLSKNKEAAFFAIDSADEHNNQKTKSLGFKAKKVEVRGDAGSLGTLLGAIEKKATSLPPSVKSACEVVRSSSVAAAGDVTLTNVEVGEDGRGGETVRADLGAKVLVAGVGELDVKVAGFREHGHAGGKAGAAREVAFDRLEASLKNKAGAEAAFFAADGQAKEAAGGKEFAFKAKKVEARGDAGNLGALFTAATQNIKMLPEKVKSAFATVSEFGVDGKGSLTLENLDVAGDKDGTRAKGDLTAGFELAGAGKVSVVVRGFSGDVTKTSKQVQFDAFETTLTNAQGAVAAHLLVEGSSGGTHDAATAGKPQDTTFTAKKVEATGSAKDLASLFASVEQHVKALPPQVVKAFDAVKDYGTQFPAAMSASMTDVELGTSDGSVVARGDLSAKVEVPDLGTVEARLKGSRAGDHPGFDSLDLKVTDKQGAEAATLHVGGVSVGSDGKSVKVGAIDARGDGTRLHGLVDARVQALLPPEIAKSLALLDKNQLAASVQNLTVKEDASGGVTASADQLSLQAAVHFVDKQGAVYTCPDAALTISGARIQLGPDRKPQQIDATHMSASGHFTGVSKSGTVDGKATLRTGTVKVLMGPGGAPLSVDAKDIQASGDVTSTQSQGPHAQDANQGNGDPQAKLKQLQQLEPTADAAAGLVKSADVRTHTPVLAGRYGKGAFSHVNVHAGTTLNIQLEVRNNALAEGTSVAFIPSLDLPLWMSAQGVHLEVNGNQGVLKTDVNWFANFVTGLLGIPTKLVTGKRSMPLDLTQLVHAAMSHFGESLRNVKPPTAEDQSDAAQNAQEGARWLKEKHANWQSDASEHARDASGKSAAERKKVKDEDATEEPRSANIGDVASQGLNLGATTGTADLELATGKKPTTVQGVTLPAGNDIHLHGQSQGGGNLNLTADEVVVQAGGNQVKATGVNSGNVHVSTGGGANHIQFDSFALKELRWDALPAKK